MALSNGARPPHAIWDRLRKLDDHEAALSVLWHVLRVGTLKMDAPSSGRDYGRDAASGCLNATIEYLERFPEFAEVVRPLKALEMALDQVRNGEHHEMFTPPTDGVGAGGSLKLVELGVRSLTVFAMRVLVHSRHFTKHEAISEVLARFTKEGIRLRRCLRGKRRLTKRQLRDWYEEATENGENRADWKLLVRFDEYLRWPLSEKAALALVDRIALAARQGIQGPVPEDDPRD